MVWSKVPGCTAALNSAMVCSSAAGASVSLVASSPIEAPSIGGKSVGIFEYGPIKEKVKAMKRAQVEAELRCF
jgi:hypothetical protein